MSAWGRADIGDQSGRVAVVTGASDGLGLAVTDALTAAGAEVVMACRNGDKAERARRSLPHSERARVELVDLSSLASVSAFGERFVADGQRLDLLINNAGVMTPPPSLTEDGIELQWATNHLGHFLLTGRVVDQLLATAGSRVVNVASLAALSGNAADRNPTTLEGYRRFPAYADSKQANLLFTAELDRRLQRYNDREETSAAALAAHPGLSQTNLASGIGIPGSQLVLKTLSMLVTQPAEDGALPLLRAATDPAAEARAYYGPAGWGERRGPPVPVAFPPAATDPEAGRLLWERSAELVGFDYLTG